MKKILIILILCLPISVLGQICNFCTSEDLKKILIENKIHFKQENYLSGDFIISSHDNKSIKTWFFKYNTCYLFKISTTEKQNKKLLKKFLDKNFIKKNKFYWENIDNSVKMFTFENNYNFVFYPKMSILNLKNINF